MRFEVVDGRIVDVAIALEAPLGDLQAVVGGGGGLQIEGLTADPARPVGSVWEGARVGVAGETSADAAVVELVGVAGLDSGARWRLAPGGYELAGRGGPRVFVDGSGSLTVDSADRDVRRVEVGETFEVGATTWIVQVPGTPMGRPEPVQGRRSFNRPPRHLPPGSAEVIEPPHRPEEPVPRARMGLAVLAGPVLVGAIMAVVFRPIMAVIALVGPLMMAMSWMEDRRRLRRIRCKNKSIWAGALDEFDRELRRGAARERDRTAIRHPGLDEVVRTSIEMRTSLWERRRHHPDYLCVSIGMGRTPWQAPVRSAGIDLDGEAVELIERYSTLPEGPIEVGLAAGSMIGIAGDRPGAEALARAMLLRLAVHHGPADLRVAVITDSVSEWEWCSWLPHTRLDALSGRYRLGSDPVDIESVMASLSQSDSPDLVVIADSSSMSPAHRTRLAALVEAGRISSIVVERSTQDLPGSCGSVVSVAGASGVLVRPGDAGPPISFAIDGVQPDVATVAARHLYGLDDPEEAAEGSRLPIGVNLGALVGWVGDVDEMIVRWSDPPEGLTATVGVTENGPLTVDLVADGPHGLIAGTTGSGKSEFLRSLVGALGANYGPDRVTFALIDYKGGSAFDACAGLPHVVGLVTDLDQASGRRALRSLHAELRHREETLRQAGAESIDDYGPAEGSGPLPRLVVIIDEFAALAADLPEFVPSLVDISQRGRSLGVHLILATQRPAGIVGDSIRANTNLRVALRVQTAADARDVIDHPVAAQLPRRFPGRGFVRLGPGELIPFQAARSTAVVDSDRSMVPAVRPVRFGWEPVAPDLEPEQSSGVTDLGRIAGAATAAFDRLSLSSPRPPWAESFPETVTLGDSSGLEHRVIGLFDDPDEQRIGELLWNPDEGGLLAFGVDESGASDAVTAAAFASACRASPDELHVYGLDGGGGSLAQINGWPHVADIVRVADRERTARVIRRLHDLLERRRRGSGRDSIVLVLVERLEAVLAAFDGPGDIAIRDSLTRVLVDGPTFSVFPLLSAARPGGVPAALASSISQRFCFRLADPFEYAAAGLTSRDVPELGRGRGFDASGKMIQIGRPSQEAVRRLLEAKPSVNPPVPVGVLPDRVPLAVVSPHSNLADDGRFVPVGIGDRDLLPVGFRLHPGDHALIAGPARSGRTTALVSIARSAAIGDPALDIVALSRTDSELTEAVGTRCRSVEELVELLDERSDAALILIDDAERVDHPGLSPVLTRHQEGLHVIAAGRADALRGLYQHWTRDLRRCRLGLSLRPQADVDGELWQTQFPRRGPVFHQPGRGYLVSGGDLEVVQVAAS